MTGLSITCKPEWPLMILPTSHLLCDDGEKIPLHINNPVGLTWGTPSSIINLNNRTSNVFKIYLQICDSNRLEYQAITFDFIPKDFKNILVLGIWSPKEFIVWDYGHTDSQIKFISTISAHNLVSEDLKRSLQQYVFRVIVSDFNGQQLEIIQLKIIFLDGTLNSYNECIHLHYTKRPKPLKIRGKIKFGSSQYTMFFLFQEKNISRIFEKFYGAHPETKTDFIIRIDAENKKYELALYRQGLKEPVVIPESAYQLIVFKNKFEDYRSENYNQPRGAWIW